MLKARDWRHYHLWLPFDMVRAKVMAARAKLVPPPPARAPEH